MVENREKANNNKSEEVGVLLSILDGGDDGTKKNFLICGTTNFLKNIDKAFLRRCSI